MQHLVRNQVFSATRNASFMRDLAQTKSERPRVYNPTETIATAFEIQCFFNIEHTFSEF